MLGITAQTLRFYSNSGLIQPYHVDPKSGYRFYSYPQFHIINRIKYLQSLGFTLPEMKTFLCSGKVEDLLPALESNLEKTLQQLEENRANAEKLRWYIAYYRYLGESKLPSVPYKRILPARYVLSTDCRPEDGLWGPGGQRLLTLQRETKFANLDYLRQHGYTLDFQSLMQDKIQPKSYFVYLKQMPGIKHPAVCTLPAGEYLCFRGKILVDEWDVSLVRQHWENRPGDTLVVADEYENNLHDFLHCEYEIQLLL